jgi:hypothetical protein
MVVVEVEVAAVEVLEWPLLYQCLLKVIQLQLVEEVWEHPLQLLLVHKDLIQFFQLLRLQAEVEDHKQQELLEEVEVEVEVVMELFQVEQEIHLQ